MAFWDSWLGRNEVIVDPRDEIKFKAYPKGHGGVWHDDGKQCWPIDEVLEPRPNPWFTKPGAEFPLEAAERADRERPSIGHAFPTLEWRQQQLDERAEVSA